MDIDVDIAEFVLPLLKKFKEKADTVPNSILEDYWEIDKEGAEVKAMEKWYEILDKMIYAFEYVIECGGRSSRNTLEWDRHMAGMELFARHFLDLWW